MKRLDNEYPNFNTVGETWVENPAYTAAWQKGNKMGKPESYLKTVMDFSFYEKLDSARHEETDGWWRGFNRVYNSLCLDYLYPDPSSVMAFIENHDTDRFLHNGQDVASLKQALALLLTIKRIPQLYYGTEVLMNGTKEITDGNVRKDFPGGFPGDTENAFTAEGRNPLQNDMFNWLSALLHWRQGNKLITDGKMTQFIPYNGIYVIDRSLRGHHAVTILNGTTEPRQMKLDRYSEVFGNTALAREVTSGTTVNLTDGVLSLPPRATLVLEF
jgi:glycosidase